MDYIDIRRVVWEVLHQELKEICDEKKCPRCHTVTTMVKVWVEPPEGESELAQAIVKWRCLNCLGLFTEELKEC